MFPCSPPRAVTGFATILVGVAVLAGSVGCTMPCSKVKAEADRRYSALSSDLRRDRDPGGEGYDLTLTLPSALVNESFQQMMEAGEIPTSHDLTTELGLSGLSGALDVRFQAELRGASFQAVEGDPARLDAHLDLRLRGTGERELFDVEAAVEGPVELEVRTAKGGTPSLYLKLGDLRDSKVDLSGEVLGQAFVAALEGLIPAGGLKNILDAIGVDTGGLTDAIEQAARDAVDQHVATVVQTLVEDSIGDVKVMELGTMEFGALELTPRAAGLRTGPGWIGIGLRTDLDTGDGALALTPPIARGRSTIQLRASEAFLNRAVQVAYVDGLIPRTLDDGGAPPPPGPDTHAPRGGGEDPQPRGLEPPPPTRGPTRSSR